MYMHRRYVNILNCSSSNQSAFAVNCCFRAQRILVRMTAALCSLWKYSFPITQQGLFWICDGVSSSRGSRARARSQLLFDAEVAAFLKERVLRRAELRAYRKTKVAQSPSHYAVESSYTTDLFTTTSAALGSAELARDSGFGKHIREISFPNIPRPVSNIRASWKIGPLMRVSG